MRQCKTEAATGKPWTPDEQAAAVQAYNGMLEADNAGRPASKAAVIRWLRGDTQKNRHSKNPDVTHAELAGIFWQRGTLAARSRGSVEAKFMNISAARADLERDTGEPWPILKGYKAAGNYQRSLVELIQQSA